MKRTAIVPVAALLVLALSASASAQGVTKYVRYEHSGVTSYGILEGDTIHQLRGNIFRRLSCTIA